MGRRVNRAFYLLSSGNLSKEAKGEITPINVETSVEPLRFGFIGGDVDGGDRPGDVEQVAEGDPEGR